jgi:hypothetical protein
MRKSLLAVLMMAFTLGIVSRASAHIGSEVYLFFEIADEDVSEIDFNDGSLDDWIDLVGDPSLDATDFFADPGVGDGAPYDPADMDYRIWFGWNSTSSTIWGAMERTDDVYVNEYAGGNLSDLWKWDSVIEFMLDGDHSGGEYGFNATNCEGCTEEEINLVNNRQAQQYLVIAEAPDGKQAGYLGAGQGWVNDVPYSLGGGTAFGDSPVTTLVEFYLTPFDNLIFNDPAASEATNLVAGNTIGFQISVPDWDVAGTYHAFHTVTGQAATWRYAERFADARLVGVGGDITAVEESSWGRVKASFE